jgi:hypothetical protein
MSITLNQILTLVGKLDDTPGLDTPRERFRIFLKENVKDVGQVRDYIEECLRSSGDQYNRALQDLVNYLGHFLEFKVTFGRYHGVQGQIGFDGLWESPTEIHIVVEVKTSETYPIKASTLVGYVDELISEKKIPDWENALGLYVVGRPDPEINQLENAILAEKRTHQLRIISAESLISLAETINAYDVSHEDILSILRPSGPTIDPVVSLIERLVGQREGGAEYPPEEGPCAGDVSYWLTPVRSDKEKTAEEEIKTLLGQDNIYAFGKRTPGRKHLKEGDWICFYATTKGIIAHARVASKPENKPHQKIRHAEKYPWVFKLENPQLYTDKPIILDTELRSKLDAFRDKDHSKFWAWFVQATRKISKHDFQILTRQDAKS